MLRRVLSGLLSRTKTSSLVASFLESYQCQLHIIESLPFAPLEKDNIAIEHCYTAIMGLEFLYDAFQASKACCTVRQNLNPVSNLITWHRVKRFLHCQPLYVLPKKERQNSSLGFVKIWLKQQSASVQSNARVHVENFPFYPQ